MEENLNIKALWFKAILLFSLATGVVWHEAVSKKVSEPGYYKGTVVNKTVAVGRSSTHYLKVEWEKHGTQTVVVHPMTYKETEIGDQYSTQWNRVFMLGAGGAAYVPNDPEYTLLKALIGLLCKTGLFGWFLVDLIIKRRKRK